MSEMKIKMKMKMKMKIPPRWYSRYYRVVVVVA